MVSFDQFGGEFIPRRLQVHDVEEERGAHSMREEFAIELGVRMPGRMPLSMLSSNTLEPSARIPLVASPSGMLLLLVHDIFDDALTLRNTELLHQSADERPDLMRGLVARDCRGDSRPPELLHGDQVGTGYTSKSRGVS